MIPDEGWLILQRAIFYELKQPQKVKDVLIKMVKLFGSLSIGSASWYVR